MRLSRLCFTALAGLCGAAMVAGAIAQPMSMPGRRGGLWKTTMTGMGQQGGSMTMSMCVDPTKEHSFSPFNGPYAHSPAGRAEAECSKHEIHKIPDGWAFESVCARAGGSVTTSGKITGDFQSHYHLELVTSGGGPERHMSMDNTWVGPCPAGGAQNSVTLPDGRVINIPAH
jgi:hypothetical protein